MRDPHDIRGCDTFEVADRQQSPKLRLGAPQQWGKQRRAPESSGCHGSGLRDPPRRGSRRNPTANMLTHCCLDPQDPYAEREVRVAFEWAADGPHLIVALDEQATDILPDLVEAQRDDLRQEIVAAFPVAGQTRIGQLRAGVAGLPGN
ncbi:hypothetical protein [Methylobacterium sp. CM6257]